MPRTKKDYSGRKEQLVRTALDLFMEKGYESTTITDLQKGFGLTKGGMYHYFESKEEILDAVIEHGLAQGIEELMEELEPLPPDKKLIHFFFSSTRDDFTRKLFQYSKTNQSTLVAYRLREKTATMSVPVLKEIIRQCIAAGLYKTEYPDEMAEFSIVLAGAIAGDGMLPQAGAKQNRGRADAFLDLWSRCMASPAEHMNELRAYLYRIVGDENEESGNEEE